MRTVLLLAVVVGLVLLLVQNISPSLPLVFLGMRSQALPLSAWLLFSVVAGAITSFLISALFQLSHYFAEQEWRREMGRSRRSSSFSEGRSPTDPFSPPRQEPTRQEPYRARAADPYPQTVIQPEPQPFVPRYATPTPEVQATTGEAEDDWSQPTRRRNPSSEDDWGDEGETLGSEAAEWGNLEAGDRSAQVSGRREYELKQQPKTESWSGSIYSYGYRDPSDSGVGRTESVYDADYRVITPPYQAPPPPPEGNQSQGEDDEDWGLDDDEPTPEKPRRFL